MLNKTGAVDHDAIGITVKKPLEPFGESNQHAALQHADGHGEFGPEIELRRENARPSVWPEAKP